MLFQVEYYTRSLALHDGVLYAGHWDNTLRAYDISTKTELFQFKDVRSIFALTVYDGVLYAGSYDSIIRAWDLTTKSELFQLKGHSDIVTSLVFYDGVLYSGSWDTTIREYLLLAR